MSLTESEELTQLKKLIDQSKFDEADQMIKSFEEQGGHPLHDTVLCHFLKCELLGERGLYKDVVELAEQTYRESLGLGKNLLSVDILFLMALALIHLDQVDKSYSIITQGEELLKTLTQELPKEYKQREAYLAFLKGWGYQQKNDLDQAIQQLELSLSLRKELGIKKEIAMTYVEIAHVCMKKSDFDRALKSLEQGLAFAEESGNKRCIGYNLHYMGVFHMYKGELNRSIMFNEQALTISKSLNNKFMTARIFFILGGNYAMKGDLDCSIRYYKQSLEIFKEYNYRPFISLIFNCLSSCYKMKGELDRALDFIKQSIILARESGSLSLLANNHDFLIQILIDKGDYEQAQNYLLDLEQLNNKLKSKKINSIYLFDKALVLKTSSRALNRGRAEEIFKQLLEEEYLIYEGRILALLNLCDLLLADLQITNEEGVLKEIEPLITQLLDLSEKSHSFWVLGETYLLQAKLALISMNLEETRKLLTQGQKIAEKYGLKQLAIKISSQHDELLMQLEMWQNLKESKVSLAERIELSRINEHMEGMIRRRIEKLPKLKAEQPILLSIMTKEGKTILSNPFTADFSIDSDYFGEFLLSCYTFCDQIFSETYDRVKFGQNTVLITALDSFSICYMFQGSSYGARQKLLHFSESIKKYLDLMKMLEDASVKNIQIKVNETTSLEELIYESFLSDPQQFQMPFKAYEGDEPYIFVSYSHTDRLQVYPIIDYLNKTGINIWYDEGIPVSENWKESIVENLERCSAFLVFITPHIIDSEYVRKEISFAIKKQKPFFSIYLKETELPSKLEFEIGDIQYMKKYLMPDTEFYQKLNRMLNPVLIK